MAWTTAAHIQAQLSQRYQSGHLINNPVALNNQAEPVVTVFRNFAGDPNRVPHTSVIIPVHNQREIITTNLNSLIANIAGTFELFIICDACTDGTLEAVTTWVTTLPPNLYTRDILLFSVVVIDQPTPVFETTADNMGFILARGKYVLEVQADMQMIQYGFNRQLERAFATGDDVFAVSGRCAHSFIGTTGIGKLGELVEKITQIPLNHLPHFFMHQTCNRGPLLIHRQRLADLGYLDEQNFWLGDDEHDLMARAATHGWVCGYIPIEFISPINQGSTRKPRSPANQAVYDARKGRAKSETTALAAAKEKNASYKLSVRSFVIC
jgi:glycosyltransferase involved in cell wall biosynthesis